LYISAALKAMEASTLPSFCWAVLFAKSWFETNWYLSNAKKMIVLRARPLSLLLPALEVGVVPAS
jgi:hypothetical protein